MNVGQILNMLHSVSLVMVWNPMLNAFMSTTPKNMRSILTYNRSTDMNSMITLRQGKTLFLVTEEWLDKNR